MKIVVISDTHGVLDEKVLEHLQNADEIWHAGDIGSMQTIKQLEGLAGRLRLVNGNIDNHTIRLLAPNHQSFNTAGQKVLITHIAGNPPKYNREARGLIANTKPNILVCGHSHILKIMFDHQNNLLFINPGSCGNHGFHKVRTIVVFEITNGAPTNMKVIELGRR
jgi:uncharacterized protein